MSSHPNAKGTMARAWFVAAIVFMAVCAYVVVAGRELTYADHTGPGPGFFPVWVGGLGLLVGAGLLWLTTTHALKTELPSPWPAPGRRAQVVLTVVGVALAGALMDYLGFRLVVFLFVAGLLRLYGMRSARAIASAAACALLVYFVFNTLLKVMLPTGVLGF